MFYYCLLRTCEISIALAIRSVDPRLRVWRLTAFHSTEPRCTFVQSRVKGVVQEGVEVIVNSSLLTKPLDFSIQLGSNLGYNKHWILAKRQNSARQNRELTVV